MFTFIYCFDKNYNIPAVVSISSLLEKVNEKINIVIVHNEKETFYEYEKFFKGHQNLHNFELKTIETSELSFPNTNNKHISEATYYRMYLDKIDFSYQFTKCVYLDSDIICINNPITYFENIYSKLENQNIPLAARTEHIKLGNLEKDHEFFERNNLSSVNYFNAGVLVFNFQEWLSKDYFKLLRDLQENYSGTLKYWDQDLLNILINGNYIEMNNFSNFHLGADWNFPWPVIDELALFIHYQGKAKPWEISCIYDSSSKFFQNTYRKIFNNKIYLRKSYFTRDIIGLRNLLFLLKIRKTEFPFTVLKESIKIIISYFGYKISKLIKRKN